MVNEIPKQNFEVRIEQGSRPENTNNSSEAQFNNCVWDNYTNDGIVQEEEMNNYINTKSDELGMNRGDINLRVGAEFKKLAGGLIGQRWQNVVSILENIARQAVNNVRGQVAAETGREPTQVPTRNAGRDYSEYDSEVVGGISNHNIDETELLNYANDMSNKLGMNLGDTNKRFVEEFIQKAGGFVGERWDNSIANLDDLAVLVANNLRGQIAAETGEETTQVPNRNFGL